MLYTKIQPQSFLGSGEEGFQEFLLYIDMVAILFNSAEPFEQIGNTLLTDVVKITVKSIFESSRFNKQIKPFQIPFPLFLF